jgi:adenine-specific DNA-methyltransferase
MDLARIEQLLGKPYYQTANCLIYNMDCLEAMQQLNSACFDLTVTSPPYNIGKEYEKILNLEEYVLWCQQWLKQIHRLTTDQGAFWLNLGYVSIEGKAKALPLVYLLWEQVPFYLIQEVVWHYEAGVAAKKFLSPRNEKFLWYVKDAANYTFNLDEIRDPNVKYPHQKKNGKLKCNPNGKNPGDVWEIPKITSGTNRSSEERTPHPAQFPLAIIDRIIKATSKPGDLVLDPFMGSGTTAAAALTLGRTVVGFELSAKYCEIAATRLEKQTQL